MITNISISLDNSQLMNWTKLMYACTVLALRYIRSVQKNYMTLYCLSEPAKRKGQNRLRRLGHSIFQGRNMLAAAVFPKRNMRALYTASWLGGGIPQIGQYQILADLT
jgi:hypothetical protein